MPGGASCWAQQQQQQQRTVGPHLWLACGFSGGTTDAGLCAGRLHQASSGRKACHAVAACRPWEQEPHDSRALAWASSLPLPFQVPGQ